MGRRLLDVLRRPFQTTPPALDLNPEVPYRLSKDRVRIPLEEAALELRLGARRVHVYPDLSILPETGERRVELILFDPDRYYSRISRLTRLRPDERLAVDGNAQIKKPGYRSPASALQRHLVLVHTGDALTLQNPASDIDAEISPLPLSGPDRNPRFHRQRALRRTGEIYGGPLRMLSAPDARATLRAVNARLENERFRPRDSDGNVGGLLELPEWITPIIVGDLHAQVDNLLRILSEGAYLESLERGEAALILLGDAVHSQQPGQWDDMDSSVLMMDLILKLKLRFPDRVFFLLGNHDSFSAEVTKGGVPQGLLWEKRLGELRGEEYTRALELFYRRSPLVVVSRDFVACHAGPPRTRISKQTLIDIRRFPKLLRELTWTRVQTTTHPAGYTRRDVRQLRQALGLPDTAAVIVGHFPVSKVGAVWRHVGNIRNHHIVYSANPREIGLFTRVSGKLVAQTYPAEACSDWLNRRAAATAPPT